jgi:hypothetical protein
MQVPPPGTNKRTAWSTLAPKYVRGVFAYDVAAPARGRARARRLRERARLNAWLGSVAGVNAQPFVVLGGINRVRGQPKRRPRSRQEYKRNFRRFVRAYVRAGKVRLLGAWNEPNFKDTRVNASTAAAFYRDASRECALPKGPSRRCTVVAGEFAGGTGPKNARYTRAYLRRIHLSRRTIVGVHTYGDVRRFQICSKPRREVAALLRSLPRKFCGSNGRGTSTPELRFFRKRARRARLWVTETGAFKRLVAKGRRVVFNDTEHCLAVNFISLFPGLRFRGPFRKRIERVYYFRFTVPRTPPDTGLVPFKRVNGQLVPSIPRRAYWHLATHRRCTGEARAFQSRAPIGITGFGVNSDDQLMADVTGDGKADAVAYEEEDGSWFVAPSLGRSFEQPRPEPWVRGHGVGSQKRMLGDVNGDRKADAVVFFDRGGDFAGAWFVALAAPDGRSFAPAQPNPWIRGHGVGADKVALSDVTGDGKADAVVYNGSDGSWHVARSNGASFDPPYPYAWIAGHGINSSDQGLDDVTADELPDAVVFFSGPAEYTGNWYVAPGTGDEFAPPKPGPWISGYGATSDSQSLDDVDGDNAADAVTFYKATGAWFVARSTGDSFARPRQWLGGHGTTSDVRFVADVTGDERGDAVAFTRSDGSWSVVPAAP